MRNNSIHTLLHIRSLPYFVCHRKTDFMVSARNSMLQPSTRAADHDSLQAVAPVLQCFILLQTLGYVSLFCRKQLPHKTTSLLCFN